MKAPPREVVQRWVCELCGHTEETEINWIYAWCYRHKVSKKMTLVFGGPPPSKDGSVRSRPIARKTNPDTLTSILKGLANE